MKRLSVVIITLLICNGLFSQGISFEHGTFSEAMEKAKKENKLVFMDCYTTWCGPCKMLAKNVFPQKEVGDCFNKHFVNLKMDMEKGEGIELAKKYNVKSFPTLLFISTTGEIVHKIVGRVSAEELIKEGKLATDPSKRIVALEKKYEEGNREPKLVAQYLNALSKTRQKEKVANIGKEFIAKTSTDRLLDEDLFTIIQLTGIEYASRECNYICKNKSGFIEKFDEESVNKVLDNAVNTYLSKVAVSASMADLEKAITECKKDFVSPNQKAMEGRLYSEHYYITRQYDKWFDHNDQLFDELIKTDRNDALLMLLGNCYRVVQDTTFGTVENAYKRAANFANKILENDKGFIAAYYCLASLYQKMGNKEKALENINIMIEKNKEVGGPEEMLTKLKQEIEQM